MSAVVIAAPRINTNDNRVQVVRWHVKPGGFVKAGKDVVDLETSKAVVTLTAEKEGYVRPLAQIKAVVAVGAPLYALAESAEALESMAEPAAAAPSSAAPAAQVTSRPSGGTVQGRRGSYSVSRFSKAALQLMVEKNLTPEQFSGAGLVTARSLLQGNQAAPEAPVTASPVAAVPVVPPGPATPRTESVSLSKTAEFQSLSIGESGNVNSMLSVTFSSEGLRRRIERDGLFNGSIQPVILFEIARLLPKYPQFTAYFQDEAIHYYDRVDLGLAVDLGRGLKVVAFEGADRLMPINFYTKSVDISLRYMRNKLTPEELTSATITVSDLSAQNILHFHPLINGHQAAIIGIGGDQFMAGHPMTLNMTFDHRISSGREVAAFLNDLRKRILKHADGAGADLAAAAAPAVSSGV